MGVAGGDTIALAAHHAFGVHQSKDKGRKPGRDILAHHVGVAGLRGMQSFLASSRTSLKPTSGFFLIRSSRSSRLKETTVEGEMALT